MLVLVACGGDNELLPTYTPYPTLTPATPLPALTAEPVATAKATTKLQLMGTLIATATTQSTDRTRRYKSGESRY